MDLRVLTLNAHQGFAGPRRRKLLSGIRDALRGSTADLVFLQEVGGDAREITSSGEVPLGREAQYEMLADQVWPQFAYGRNAVAGRGHQGNALLSKYPITHWDNLDVSIGSAEPRGFLHCVIGIPGKPGPLHTVCVHLGLTEAHRRQQVDTLIRFIGDTVPDEAPLVIAGDFNDWRRRAHRQIVTVHSLAEVFDHALGAPARTFPAWCPLLPLDRIYVRNMQHRPLLLRRQSWAGLSDHVPLAADVTL